MMSENTQPESNTFAEDPNGWLLKRSKLLHNWKKQWFSLNNAEQLLIYGETRQSATKTIPLQTSEIAESNIDHKKNVFVIKVKETKRSYYIQAEDEITKTNWMEAICMSKASGSSESASQACSIQ